VKLKTMRRPTVSKDRAQTFEPVNQCIYCGGLVGLTREHILPIGLGGGLILPRASCPACQAITKEIETKCQRGHLLPYRREFGLVRHPHELPKLIPIQIDGHVRLVDPEKVPSFLILPKLLDFPGIVTGGVPGASMRYQFRLIGNQAEMRKLAGALGGHITGTTNVDTDAFLRMLAKIAHGFAVSQLGLNGFDPELPPFILGQSPDLAPYLLGNSFWPDIPIVPGHLSHQLGLTTIPWGDQHQVAVRIQLFAAHGAPSYTVIAGAITLSREQQNKLGL
jgi:hypothetical protein